MTEETPPAATPLFDRIQGSMTAAAIGDAMGGPVEGQTFHEIAKVHGVVDGFLPYTTNPDYHSHFQTAAGSITDDTRLRHLVVKALTAEDSRCRRGYLPRRGDLAWAIVQAYHQAATDLERGFLEEYALGAVYGEEKLIWGGQMTNGFLMANAPLGLICPGDPATAFALSYDLDFISDGYATYAAAMGAAAVAAAMTNDATPESVAEAALAAAREHRTVGATTRAWQWYRHVFELNERLVATAVEIAARLGDVFALRESYYRALHVSGLGSEAGQTLAVALGMFVAAGGDLRQTVIGCVNYGRDNDSYASIGGAISGAMHGMAAVPDDWRLAVEEANPELYLAPTALKLAQVVVARYRREQRALDAVAALLGG